MFALILSRFTIINHAIVNHQPAYNHSHPAYNHHQPAYVPRQPPAFTSVPHQFSSPPFLYQPRPVPVSHIVNVLAPSPSPSPVAIIPKTLPTVTYIPLLTSKADFFAWDEGVGVKVDSKGKERFRRPLRGHVSRPCQQGLLAGTSSPSHARLSSTCPLCTVVGLRLSWHGASGWQMLCRDMKA